MHIYIYIYIYMQHEPFLRQTHNQWSSTDPKHLLGRRSILLCKYMKYLQQLLSELVYIFDSLLQYFSLLYTRTIIYFVIPASHTHTHTTYSPRCSINMYEHLFSAIPRDASGISPQRFQIRRRPPIYLCMCISCFMCA